MSIVTTQYKIREDLAIALVNGYSDTSTEAEDFALEDFENEHIAQANGAAYAFDVTSERILSTCAVTNETADCLIVNFNIIH